MNSFGFIKIFELRTLRERLLITATLGSIVWGVWIISFGGMVMDHQVEVERDITRVAAQLQAQTLQQQQTLKAWPDRLALMREKESLRELVDRADERINTSLAQALSPSDVLDLFRTVLGQHRGIELVALANLEPSEVVINGESTGLYRHPLQVTLEGGYADVVAYLQSLETTPYGLRFRSLSYVVVEHPNARVEIEVDSFSRFKAWIGA